jgi:hypothetical protein
MTDALKVAVREALAEVIGHSYCVSTYYNIASALARRGVVLAGEGHNQKVTASVSDALQSLPYVLSDLDGNMINDAQFAESVDKITQVLIAKGIIGSAYGGSTAPHASREDSGFSTSAAGESPAPKPARKVVQVSAADSYALAVCNDGAVLIASPGMGYDEWRILPPIPQPGDEQ